MRRYFPDFEGFQAAARAADIVPVYRQLLADRLTPVSAFEVLGATRTPSCSKASSAARRSPATASSPPPRRWSTRFRRRATPAGPRRAATPGDLYADREFDTSDPLADLQKLLPTGRYHRDPDLPPFTGGLVGYAGYDTIRYYEGEKLPRPPEDDRRLPDLLFGLYGELVIFDHVDKTIKVVANAEVGSRQNAVGSEGDSAAPAFCLPPTAYCLLSRSRLPRRLPADRRDRRAAPAAAGAEARGDRPDRARRH